MAAFQFLRPLAPFYRRVLAGALAANLFVAGLAVLWLTLSREQHLDGDRITSSNLAQSLVQYTLGLVRNADMALQTIALDYAQEFPRHDAGNGRFGRLVSQQLALLPEFESLRMADANGLVRYGRDVVPATQISVADRGFFIALRSQAESGLVISEPIIGRFTNRPAIALGRRLSQPDGSFAGVVFANLEIEQLSRAFSAINIGAQGSVTLRGEDLGMIVRYPELPGVSTTVGNSDISPEFRRMVAAGHATGTFRVKSGIDKIERTFGYSKVADYPLYLVVGIATDESLADWRREVVGVAALVACFLLLTLAMSWTLITSWRTQAASEQRLRLAFDAASEGLWDWNLLTDQVYLAPHYYEMSGYRPERTSPKFEYFKRTVHPDDLPQVLASLEAHLEGTTAFSAFDYRLIAQSGEIKWVAARGRVVERDVDGAPLRMIGTILDITQRKAAEEQIRVLSEAVAQSPESIVITDAAGCIEYVNQAFERNSGYALAEVVGKEPRLFHSETTPRETLTDLRTTLSLGQTWRGEFANQRKDGTDYVEFVIVTPIRQPDGRIAHFVAIIDDITDNKRLNAELDEHRHHLEELVQRRTAELRATRAHADAANKAKSAFLANISHEIRTPLNAILGLAQIGMRENSGRKPETTCRQIHDAGSDLLEIINDVLDLSKIEAGKMTVVKQSFRLNYVVEQVTGMLAARARTKELIFSCNYAGDPSAPASVLGDPLRLKQVLLNLLGNAIKFTVRGEVRLTIVREEDQAIFHVADSGPGISQEHLGRLFRPFEQADGSTTRIYGGTGLGLTISRDFAILMGGDISVKSAIGQGSLFTLRLPLPEGLPTVEDVEQILPDSGPHLTGLRVLVADDVHLNRVILEDLITGQGATAVFAANGQLAVDQVRASGAAGFDIVLMDVQMPVMDGYEATRCIHRLAPELPVIGITAHAMQDERERCLAAGMADHVPKPVDSGTLIRAILAAVGRRRRTPGAAEPATQSPADTPAALDALAEVPLIDWTALSARYGYRQDFIRKLIAVSLETHSESPKRLRAAARSGDHAAVRSLAHALRSIAGNLAADRLAASAEQVERSASDGFADSPVLAEELADQVEDLLATLRNQLEKAVTG